jgi:hypothetical protein
LTFKIAGELGMLKDAQLPVSLEKRVMKNHDDEEEEQKVALSPQQINIDMIERGRQ